MSFQELMRSDISFLFNALMSLFAVLFVVALTKKWSGRYRVESRNEPEGDNASEGLAFYYNPGWLEKSYKFRMFYLFLLFFVTLTFVKYKFILHTSAFEPIWLHVGIIACCWLILFIISVRD
jgi:hypothetical protein